MVLCSAQSLTARYRWLMLFVCLLACDIYYFALQSIPPLLYRFESIFAIDKATAGLLMSIVVIPGIILALPAGLLISKYGFRKIGTLALICVALGSLITSFSINFSIALLGRLTVGFGSCFLTIGTASIIPQWFKKNEIGLAMGIYCIGSPAATITAFFVVPLMAEWLGWQSPFYLGAIIGIIFSIIFAAIVKNSPIKSKIDITKPSDIRSSLTGNVLRVSIMWFLFSVASSSFITWTPNLLLTFKEINPVFASMISSLYMVSSIFFIPFYGWISDRIADRRWFVIIGLFATAISMYVFSYMQGLTLIWGILFVGAAAGIIPALAFVLMAHALPSQHIGIGFGIMSFSNRIATVIGAPLIGFVLQTTQSINLTLFFISIFAFFGAVTVLSSYYKKV
jgi:predicted MFS family arabinose efflux permease